MKKILPIILLAVLLITGCQGAKTPSPEEVRKMTLNQERRIGVLQSLGGAFTSSQATHLLRMEDGKTLALKSTVVDLKSDKYIGKQVEVMGGILRTTDGNQIMTVENIDIIDTEGQTDDQIPQWLDYNSNNLKISFKYRDDYQVEEKDKIVITRKPTVENNETPATVSETGTDDILSSNKPATEIQIEKVASDEAGLVEAMGIKSLSSADVLAEGYNRSKITQKAIEAYKKSENSGQKIVYFFLIGDAGYKVSFIAVEEEENLVEEQNMFYDILASIDFAGEYSDTTADSEAEDLTGQTTQSDTAEDLNSDAASTEEDTEIESIPSETNISGFETFKSESQNFTIQYPKSYYFGSATPSSSDAIRSYQFGSKPLEEVSGEIILDIVKGGLPDGKTTEYAGLSMIRETSGATVSLYLEKSGKVYRLSGEKSDEGLLKQMAATLQ